MPVRRSDEPLALSVAVAELVSMRGITRDEPLAGSCGRGSALLDLSEAVWSCFSRSASQFQPGSTARLLIRSIFARLRKLESDGLRLSKDTEGGRFESVSSVVLEEEATGAGREGLELDCCMGTLPGVSVLDGWEELASRWSACSLRAPVDCSALGVDQESDLPLDICNQVEPEARDNSDGDWCLSKRQDGKRINLHRRRAKGW